jgi:CheY-like chemotaxis protein
MLSSQRPSGVRDSSDGRRVLIVDDNADSAELLLLVLGNAGYESKIASTPAAAIALGPEFCPHVALIDIGLPDMDGYALLRILRTLPELARCRFVAVSGYGSETAPPGNTEARFECHLTKPVDLEKLLRTLASLAEASEATASQP